MKTRYDQTTFISDKFIIGATKQEIARFDRKTSKKYRRWALLAAVAVLAIWYLSSTAS
jgi:hypothetical protein